MDDARRAWLNRAMELEGLRAFATLARERRFTRAARTLGISQPSLSRRVQRLERDLGAKLVIRAREGVVLTEAGQRLLPHAERALVSLESAQTELSELSGQPKGSVVLGTLATVGAYVLPAVITAFHRKHPGVRLSVREGFRDELEAHVARGEVDLAIIQLPAKREELTAVPLWKEDYLLAVPATHPMAQRRGPVAMTDVASEPFVVIPGGTTLAALEVACRARRVTPHVALTTDNVESVRRMVEAGLGLALVPRIMAQDRRHWRAALIAIAPPGVHRRVAMVHRGTGYLSAAARALRDAIVSHARREFSGSR